MSNAEADALAEGLESGLTAAFTVLEAALKELLEHSVKQGWSERKFIDEAVRLIGG